MAARASSRAGGFAGSARHDAEIAAAAVGMSVEEWLSAAARPATPPPAHGDSESVARILSSLDRLGARIRTLTPAAEPAPAAPAARPVSTADSLQRAIDQIARKRDALERSSARRPEPAREAAAPVREPAAEIAEIGARVMALTQTPRGPAARAAAPADGLRQDVAELKDMLAELVAASPAETLESSFRGLVERIDDLRATVDNPRAVADLVQRLADIRRLFTALPDVTQFADLTERLDDIAARIDRGQSDPRVLSEFGRSLGELASAVARLDQRDLVAGIERRLDDVAGDLRRVEERLAGPIGALERWTETSGRQTTLMSQIAQRSEQLPRLAHELERQAASVDRIARATDALPRLSETIDTLRASLDGDFERHHGELKTLFQRLEDLAQRLDDPVQPLAIGGDDGLERRLGEIVERLDGFRGSLDAATIDAIDAQFARMSDNISRQLRDLGRPEQAAGSSADQLLEALGRIEAQLADSAPTSHLLDIEDRIGVLTQSIDKIDFATARDVAALDQLLRGLRDDIAGLTPQDNGRVEAEIRRLADQIARTQAPALDIDAFTRIEERLTRLVDRIEDRPAEVAALAEALEKLETTIAGTLSVDAIADRVATAAERAQGGEPRPALDLTSVENELRRLTAELRAGADHDRDLLIAIGDAVQKLAEREIIHPAASQAQATETPAEATAVNDSWQTIEKALATNFSRPAETAAVPAAAEEAEPADDMPRIFGRKQKVAAPKAESDGEGRIEPAFDVNKPLEPGSGKPRLPVDEPEATSEATPAAPKPDTPLSKADFIAAARRAALAAGNEGGRKPAAGDRSGDDQPRRALRLALPPVLVRHKRQFLMGIAAAVLVAGLVHLGSTLLLKSDSPLAAVSGDAAAPVAPPAPTKLEVLPPPASEPPAATDTPPASAAPGPLSSVPADDVLSGKVDTATTFTDQPATSLSPDRFSAGDKPVDMATADPMTTAATNLTAIGSGLPLPPNAIGPLALRQAAASGDAAAQYEVAARYAEGRGVAPDLTEAIAWYGRAADTGLAPAQYRLASLYEKGQGVARDTKTAAALYAKAASQGNAKAMHNLAVLNAEGGLGEPNYQVAARLFQQAADFGVRDSQFNLGILFARGLGVPRDLASSYKWFAIAANGGDGDSAKKRDDIAQVLSKEDLARARLAVETWQAKPLDPAANDVAINPAWTAAPEHTATVDESRTIARVQAMLTRMGFDVGAADGRLGKKTRDAITAFQKAHGQPATGEIDKTIIDALGGSTI